MKEGLYELNVVRDENGNWHYIGDVTDDEGLDAGLLEMLDETGEEIATVVTE